MTSPKVLFSRLSNSARLQTVIFPPITGHEEGGLTTPFLIGSNANTAEFDNNISA